MAEEQPQLSEKELIAIRDLLEADRRAKWLVGKIKALALWTIAVLSATTILWEYLAKLARHLFK